MGIKHLFNVAGLAEIAIGIPLMLAPSAVSELLLGVPLDGAAVITLGRIAGAALFALGLACWLAPADDDSGTARSLHTAMLAYNLAAVMVLGSAAMNVPTAGIILWVAIAAHVVLTVWFMLSFKRFN